MTYNIFKNICKLSINKNVNKRANELNGWFSKNRKANTQMSNEYLNMYEIELSGKCENCLSFYHTPIRMDMI